MELNTGTVLSYPSVHIKAVGCIRQGQHIQPS